MIAAIDRVTTTAGAEETGTKPQAPASEVDPGQIASKTAFLRLLVAQIRHQNPLNPADGVQFLTQLAEFSELEQLIGIRQALEAMGDEAEGSPAGDAPAVTGA